MADERRRVTIEVVIDENGRIRGFTEETKRALGELGTPVDKIEKGFERIAKSGAKDALKGVTDAAKQVKDATNDAGNALASHGTAIDNYIARLRREAAAAIEARDANRSLAESRIRIQLAGRFSGIEPQQIGTILDQSQLRQSTLDEIAAEKKRRDDQIARSEKEARERERAAKQEAERQRAAFRESASLGSYEQERAAAEDEARRRALAKAFPGRDTDADRTAAGRAYAQRDKDQAIRDRAFDRADADQRAEERQGAQEFAARRAAETAALRNSKAAQAREREKAGLLDLQRRSYLSQAAGQDGITPGQFGAYSARRRQRLDQEEYGIAQRGLASGDLQQSINQLERRNAMMSIGIERGQTLGEVDLRLKQYDYELATGNRELAASFYQAEQASRKLEQELRSQERAAAQLAALQEKASVAAKAAQLGYGPAAASRFAEVEGFKGDKVAFGQAQRDLSTGKASQEINGLRERADALRQVAKAGGTLADVDRQLKQNQIEQETGNKKLAQAHRAAADEVAKLEGGFKKTTASGSALYGLLGNLASRTLRLAAVIGGFAAIRAFGSVVSDLFLFNSEVEQARLGIASTIQVSGQFADALGQPLPLADQLHASLSEADQALRYMREDAVKLGLPLDQIMQGFAVAAGQARAAGFGLKESVTVSEGLVVLAQRLGVPIQTLNKTIDNLFSGLRVGQTTLGRVLGLTDEIVKKHIEQNDLQDFFLQKLKGVLALQEEIGKDTFAGQANSIKSTLELLSEETAGGAFKVFKDGAHDLLEELTRLRDTPDTIAAINAGLTGTAKIISYIAQLAGKSGLGLGFAVGTSTEFLEDLAAGIGAQSVEGNAPYGEGLLETGRRVRAQDEKDIVDRRSRRQLDLAADANKLRETLEINPNRIATPETRAEIQRLQQEVDDPELNAPFALRKRVEQLNKQTLKYVANSASNDTVLEKQKQDIPKREQVTAERELGLLQEQFKSGKATEAQVVAKINEVADKKIATEKSRLLYAEPAVPGTPSAAEIVKNREAELTEFTKGVNFARDKQIEALDRKSGKTAATGTEKARSLEDLNERIRAIRNERDLVGIKGDIEGGASRIGAIRAKEDIAGANGTLTQSRRLEFARETQAIERDISSTRLKLAEREFAFSDETLKRREAVKAGLSGAATRETIAKAEEDIAQAELGRAKANQEIVKAQREQSTLLLEQEAAIAKISDSSRIIRDSFSDFAKGVAQGTTDLGQFGKRISQGITANVVDRVAERQLKGIDQSIGKLTDGASDAISNGIGAIGSALFAGSDGSTGSAKIRAPSPESSIGVSSITQRSDGTFIAENEFGQRFGAADRGQAENAAKGGSRPADGQEPATGGASSAAVAGAAAGVLMVLAGTEVGVAKYRELKDRPGITDNQFRREGGRAAFKGAGLPGYLNAVIGLENPAVSSSAKAFGVFVQPNPEEQTRRYIGHFFETLGLPKASPGKGGVSVRAAGIRGGPKTSVDNDLLALGGQAETVGRLLGAAEPRLPEQWWLPGRFKNALLNNLQALRLSGEDSQRIISNAAASTGKSLDEVGFRMASLRVKGKATDEVFLETIAAATQAYGELRPIVNATELAFSSLDTKGRVSMVGLKRTIQDATLAIEGGITVALQSLETLPSMTQAGAKLGNQFAETFLNRVNERFLQRKDIGDALSKASRLSTESADAIASGDFVTGNRLAAESRQYFNIGRATFLNAAAPVAANARNIARGFGYQNIPGIEAELPSFDTPTVATVPGGRGAAMMAMVHGGEKIRNPRHEDMLLNEMRGMREELAALRSYGSKPTIVVQPAAVDVSVAMDGTAMPHAIYLNQSRQRSGLTQPNGSATVTR